MGDDFLNDLWGDDAGDLPEVDYGEPYGIGTWPNAILMDADAVDEGQFGFEIKLIINLKGEEGMKYTTFLRLPRTPEENGDPNAYERRMKANEGTRNNIHGLLKTADLLGGKLPDVNDIDKYEKVLSIFRHGVGKLFPCRVKQSRRFNKETQKWEGSRFTELVCITARGK